MAPQIFQARISRNLTWRHSHSFLHVHQDVPILVADASDSVALGEVLKQTQVVLAMAGPYALYGDRVSSWADNVPG